MIYRLFFKLVLQRIPAETAHSLTAALMMAVGRIPGAARLLRRLLGARDPALAVDALGRTFPSPLGVAAGLDKNLTWFEVLGALGFGFVEVGTVTAVAQEPNEGVIMRRLVEDRALINRMGFPNRGATAAAARLARRSGDTIVGINAGKSRVATDVAADYRRTIRELAPLADFVVLNVSSPNTAGLRDLQTVEALGDLVTAVRAELRELGVAPPLLVKIAPDLADADIEAIADLALRMELNGIIATNTTISREGLRAPRELTEMAGGLSGAPLKARSVDVLRLLRARTRGEITLVSVGGVESAEDVWERILAGASLVQAYTGFVYGGPLWPARVNRALAERVRAAGAGSIGELVGSAAPAYAPTAASSVRVPGAM